MNSRILKTTFFTALICFFNFTLAQEDNAYSVTTMLRLDKVAFEETDMLQVIDENNEVVAYYDRFSNKSSAVKSLKLLDKNQQLIYTLVPIINRDGFEIHIQDSLKNRGLISLKPSLNGMSVKIESTVDFFDKPYEYTYKAKVGFGTVSTDEIVYFDGKEVVNFDAKGSVFKGFSISPYEVNRQFFEQQPYDAVCWVVLIELFDELLQESNKYRRSVRNTGTQY